MSLDPNISAFLVDGVTWGKKTDDDADVPVDSRRTAAQKVNILEFWTSWEIYDHIPVMRNDDLTT